MWKNLVVLSVERVKEIIALNKKGEKVDSLEEKCPVSTAPQTDFHNVVGQDSLTRFDASKKRLRDKRNRYNQNNEKPRNSKPNNHDNNN